jgi:hypothetical protein
MPKKFLEAADWKNGHPGACNIKLFTIVIYNHNDRTIVIYDHNDSGQYYKTMILANLALARSVNFDREVCCKLKRT